MSTGLLHSAQALLANLLGLARTRLELFGTELEEELTRLATLLLGALVVLLLAALGIALAVVAFMLWVPPEQRVAVAGMLAALFLGAAAAMAWSIRRLVNGKPRAFDASLAELERDYDALKS